MGSVKLGTTLLIALVVSGLLSQPAQAQGCDPYVIQGKVLLEGQPAQGVTVELYYYSQKCTYRAVSDENGVYAILISPWVEGENYRITAQYNGLSFEAHNRFIKYQEGGILRQGDDVDIILGETSSQDYTEIGFFVIFTGILMLVAVAFIYKDMESEGVNKREKQ